MTKLLLAPVDPITSRDVHLFFSSLKPARGAMPNLCKRTRKNFLGSSSRLNRSSPGVLTNLEQVGAVSLFQYTQK